MDPSSTISHCQSLFKLTCFYALFLFFLFNFFCPKSGYASEISYSDHCGSIVPEVNPTSRDSSGVPLLDIVTSYFWGGEQLLGKSSSDKLVNGSDISLSFYTRNIYGNNVKGIYKIQAQLKFHLPYAYSNYSGYGQNYHPREVYRRRSLRFSLTGFWSEDSRKLCMVGTGYWSSGEGKPHNLEAVFELNYAKKNPTLFTSLAKGTLTSLSSSNSPFYFEPIQIVAFPQLSDYNYALASKGLGGGCLGGINIPPKQSLSLQPGSICSTFSQQSFDFELEHAAGCTSTRDCSPVQGNTSYLSLYTFQCLEDEEKLRYMIAFQNVRYGWRFQFDPKTTLIGEGSWDSEKNQLCIVACRILNPFKSLGDVRVGDCSIRLSVRFRVAWTIKDSSSIVGQIWTNKTSIDQGYFKMIKFSSSNSNGNNAGRMPGLKYEYTQMDKVRELCPKKEVIKKNGDEYPKGNSNDMKFDMSLEQSGKKIAWGYAVPISVEDEFYEGSLIIISDSGNGEEEATTSYSSPMKISYQITFSTYQLNSFFFSLNSSLNHGEQPEISAEGVYDAETGHLCMVGCRKLYSKSSSEKSLDCEILMKFEFPPSNSRVGSFVKGIIQSRRAKTDSLYFEQLNISASSFYGLEAKQSLWRMDLEIIMVLISDTLACIFVVSQLFYVKKHREILPFISLVMLTILTVGHMIPLVLNLEALFLKNHDQQNVILRGDGWLELNEVSVRLVTLVVFLLLLRLLQLAWTARMEDGNRNHLWSAEKKTVFVSVLLYALVGLMTLLLEWEKNGNDYGTPSAPLSAVYNSTEVLEPSTISQQSFTLRYLKSYAGLILDGFLFPQIVLNMFQNSRENALSRWFYVGTTSVRLLPHAYDLYRVQNYIRQDFDGAYIYANHSADFYSIAWDLIIPCGCILLAVIIWLQQQFGGRCFLPRKVQELWSYEKVPAVGSE